jgi:hypothetical protein
VSFTVGRRRGAAGLARKSADLAISEDTFLRVAAGDFVLPDTMVGLAELLNRRLALPSLTDKQAEVLHACARGESWKLIASRLYITERTAQDRLDAVNAKMMSFLHTAGLPPDAAADIERVLGLQPGDLNHPDQGNADLRHFPAVSHARSLRDLRRRGK